MCKIYNSIGSLTTLKTHLDRHKINEFKSLKDVIEFKDSFSYLRQKIISMHENLIEHEQKMLILDLEQLNTTLESQKLQKEKELNDEIDKLKELLKTSTDLLTSTNFQRFIKHLKQLYYRSKIHCKQSNLDSKVKRSIRKLVKLRKEKNNRYQSIILHFDDAVKQSCEHPLTELERKNAILEELSPFIYGALGEQKVVEVLEGLPDEYFLINDFSISFSRPIYHRQDNDYIKSIQIDHILIAPSGVFLIETKNWSEKSLENLSLRSPVKQIKRTSFVLFKILSELSDSDFHLDKHHWGDKKIPLRNLIVLTHSKPKEEFQYVKILTLNELIRYVKYFQPTFSNIETQRITDYLLDILNNSD